MKSPLHMTPSKQSSTNMPKASEDRVSMLSAGSSDNSALLDSASNVSAKNNSLGNLRKFTTGVGRGQAREIREACTKAMNVNPLRKCAKPEPIDYENFIVEKSAQLDNEKNREIILFPRDDVTEGVRRHFGSEKKATEVYGFTDSIESVEWLLARDCLYLYNSRGTVINYNYSHKYGDYDEEVNNTGNLTSPRFEIDQRLDEERQELQEQECESFKESRVICEGMVLQLSSDNSLLEKFRNGKKRYCRVKHETEKNNVVVELMKVSGNNKTLDLTFLAKSTMINNNKNKSVIVLSDKSSMNEECMSGSKGDSKQKMILLAGGDEGLDITKWFFTIDKSIKICQVNRNSQTVDCASITSEKADSGQDVISSNGDFNVDELNELGSISSATSAKFQKGKNAAAKILQPPVVIRNNLFKLYHELSPLPSLQEKQGNVLTRASNLDKHFSREINRASARKGSMSNQQRPSELTLTTSISPTTKLARRISIEITDLNFKALISPTTSEQIEPFVVKAFIYDSRQNLRLSEEFSIGFSTPEHDEWLRESGVYGGDRLNSSSPSMNTSYSSAEFPTTISLENILTKNNMKVLFTFANIHEFIFLVVKVERVFSNTSMDPYFKPFTDLKLAVKYKKAVTTAISKLGQYRTCCAWGVRSIFKGDCDEKMKLYKCEGKFTESDLCKNLNEFHRLEKNGKIVAYPQASLSTRIEDGVRGSAIGQCLNSSLRIIPEESTPLSESPNQSMASKVNLCSPKQQLYFLYEIQAFGDVITRPYSSIVNLLYVYPIHLLYGNQKSFSKARNIICSVSYVSMSGDSNGDNVNRLVDTSNPAGPFLPSQECSVQYHEQSPQFNSEMKIILPVNLKPSDHLLFSFKHISVSAALSDKKNRESIVSNVGYAWLPLSQKETFIMKDDVQEFEIPVSMNLPDNYTNSFVSKGLCDAKYIDNGKGLFKVRMRLISSLISPEPRIQSFFQNCLYLQNCLKGKTMNIPHSKSHDETINNVKKNSFKDKHPNSVEVSHSASIQNNSQLNDTSIIHSSTTEIQQFIERVGRRCDSLLTVDPDKITPFLYVIINRILSMMPLMTITNASNQMIKCLFGIIDKMHSIHKSHLFKKYVLGIFSNETCAIKSNDSVHEALIVGLTPFLNNSESDTELVAIIFKHLKVVLDVVLKSMSLHVVSNGLNKVSRPERFSPAFLESIRSFVHVLVNMICEKCQILSRENLIHANASLMYFLRGCLSLTDRGYILRQFSYSALKWDKYENSILRSLKFDLIQNLVFHEHYLQLCLPLLCDKNLNILRIDGLKESSTPPAQDNSSGLFVRFFGQLFSNTSNISELASMNTYTPYAENFILNELYCHVHFPIGMLFQELAAVMKEPKENRKKVIKLLRNILAKHSFDDRYSSSVIQSRIATLYSPLIRFVLENIIEIEHSASTLALSNDSYNSNLKQSELPLTPLTQKTHKNITHSNDSSKISNSNSQSTLKDFNVSTPNTPLKNIYRSGEDKMLLSIIHEQPSPSNGVTALSETLDRNEVRDLLVSVLYVIHNLPPNIFRAVINSFDDSRLTRNDSSKKNGCEKVSAVELLCRQFELILQFFRHEPQEVFVARYLTQAKKTRPNAKVSIQIPETGHENDPMVKDEQQKAQLAYMQECNLIQEVSLITLAAAQTLANHISTQAKLLSFEEIEKAFVKLLQIQIKFLNEENPENVRLHALAAVAIFVTIFQKRLFINGTLNPLADLIEALLLQLNSRLVSVQNSAAALLQLIYRTSFDLLSSMSSAFYRSDENGLRKLSFNSVNSSCLIEKLGRPGTQSSVSLAKLLGQKHLMARSTRFQRGLNALGLIVDRSGGKHATTYENSVHCLIKQMKQVLNATKALQDSLDNPIKLTDLHIQLADSYRGSSSLRFAWLQSLATSHFDLKWYSEASVCQAHCLAIIGIELEAKKLIKINWALFDTINEGIVKEYNILRADTEIIQPAGFTIENFTSKAEQLMKNLLMAERYEAVSAVCRMILPIFEEQHNYYRANFICTELQQAYCRLNEIKTSGRRHLASYFKVVFFGKLLLGEDHETEWIYREPGLTPLAEASEKMLESIKHSLGHDNVKLIMEKEVSAGNLKDNVAYVQMTHVHPFLVREGPDNMNYWANTNIKSFYYDEPKIDSSAPSGSSEIAKQLIKKVFVTIDEPFPSMKRRQRVIGKKEQILNPLEVACESLIKKANQIRKVIKNAKDASHFNVISTDNYDKSFLDKLDLKGLQLLLQGSVQATVNAGPLAYGEGFSTTIQMQRYGEAGINKLIRALKQLLYQCSEALKINEIAVASDQVQYQQMLKCSFEALIERLSEYFGEDKMALTSDDIINEDNDIMSEVHTKSIHILDSIAGVMQSK